MSGGLVRLNGVSNDMDVILKRSMDGLERPHSDAPVYLAVVPQIQKQTLIRTAAMVVLLIFGKICIYVKSQNS